MERFTLSLHHFPLDIWKPLDSLKISKQHLILKELFRSVLFGCRAFITARVHCSIKPRPNDRNMPTQHIATLLGATCCVQFGHPVAMCCDVLCVVGSSLKMVKFEPKTPSMSQHVSRNDIFSSHSGKTFSLTTGIPNSRFQESIKY